MPQPLPRWLFRRYAKLWKERGEGKFDYDAARQTLKEKDDKTLSVILSELRKHGWLEITLDRADARKRIYQLRPPQDITKEIAE